MDLVYRQSRPLFLLLLIPWLVSAAGRPVPGHRKPFSLETAEHFSFRAIEDDKGGFYVVWPHQKEGYPLALLAQHGSIEKDRLWPHYGLYLTTGTISPTDWDAFSDGHSGFVVTWEENDRIRAQRYDTEGHPLWSKDVNFLSNSHFKQLLPTGAPDGGGGAYIAWSERRFPDRDVLMIQHINAQGYALWGKEGVRVSLRPSDQRRPRVIPDGSAGAIVAWNDVRESASQLQTQRIDYQGMRLWGNEGQVVTAPAGLGKEVPNMDDAGRGSSVLAWVAAPQGSNEVFLQSMTPNGELRWNPNGEVVAIGQWEQWNPVLYGDGGGGTWVGWEDYRNQQYWQVHLRYVRIDKEARSGPDIALAALPTDQGRLALTYDGLNGVFAAWIDGRSGPAGVYLQEVSPDGNLLCGDQGLAAAEGLVKPSVPQVVDLGPKKAAVFWVDEIDKNQWVIYKNLLRCDPPGGLVPTQSPVPPKQ